MLAFPFASSVTMTKRKLIYALGTPLFWRIYVSLLITVALFFNITDFHYIIPVLVQIIFWTFCMWSMIFSARRRIRFDKSDKIIWLVLGPTLATTVFTKGIIETVAAFIAGFTVLIWLIHSCVVMHRTERQTKNIATEAINTLDKCELGSHDWHADPKGWQSGAVGGAALEAIGSVFTDAFTGEQTKWEHLSIICARCGKSNPKNRRVTPIDIESWPKAR